MFTSICLSVVNAVGAIHDLRNPHFLKRIPRGYEGLVEISAAGKKAFQEPIFNISNQTHSWSANYSKEATSAIETVANFVHVIRHLLYSIIGYLVLFKESFHQIERINEYMLHRVLGTSEWLEPAYWKVLLDSVFGHYIIECPEKNYDSVVLAVYPGIMTHYSNKIVSGLIGIRNNTLEMDLNTETYVNFIRIVPL